MLGALWKLGAGSIREIQEACRKIAAPNTRRCRRSSIDSKEKARAAREENRQRPYLRAAREPAVDVRHAHRDFIGTLGGSHEPLVAHLVESGKISSGELKQNGEAAQGPTGQGTATKNVARRRSPFPNPILNSAAYECSIYFLVNFVALDLPRRIESPLAITGVCRGILICWSPAGTCLLAPLRARVAALFKFALPVAPVARLISSLVGAPDHWVDSPVDGIAGTMASPCADRWFPLRDSRDIGTRFHRHLDRGGVARGFAVLLARGWSQCSFAPLDFGRGRSGVGYDRAPDRNGGLTGRGSRFTARLEGDQSLRPGIVGALSPS